MSMSPRIQLLSAYAAIYLIWGSTYLVIRLGIETMPPFLFAGIRFLAAGIPLLLFLALRGAKMPTGRQWLQSSIVGALMLAGGNGMVTLGEKTVPSSIAALLITTVPLWIVVLDALVWRRSRLGWSSVAGLACGFFGVVLLVGPAGSDAEQLHLPGVLILLSAALSWAIGSLRGRDAKQASNPLVVVGAQSVAGGLVLVLLAAARGEFAAFHPGQTAPGAWVAIVYLAFFGTVVALSAYHYLLRHQPASSVATYAFVNPIVAVLLGVGLGGESLHSRQLMAGALIVGAVALLHSTRMRRKRRPIEESVEGASIQAAARACGAEVALADDLATAGRSPLTRPSHSATRSNV